MRLPVHQSRLFAQTDRASLAVDRVLGLLWRDLLAVIRQAHGHRHGAAWLHMASLRVLARVPLIISGTLQRQYLGLFYQGHRAALRSVQAPRRRRRVTEAVIFDPSGAQFHGPPFQFVPHPAAARKRSWVTVWVDPRRLDAEWQRNPSNYLPPEGKGRGLSEVPGRRERFGEFLGTGQAIQQPKLSLSPIGDGGGLNPDFDDGRHRFAVLRDLGFNRVPVSVPRNQAAEFQDRYGVDEPLGELDLLLLPPPPEHSVLAWLDRFVRPADWERIGTPNDRRMPQELAAQLAADYSQGLSPQELARNLLPFLDGQRVRARRAARTFGLHVAASGQHEAWDQIGDMIVGFQIHATVDEHTRPEHRRRNGTIYWKRPGPGQLGLEQMPRPPLEANGSIAWNCRCWISPVLR